MVPRKPVSEFRRANAKRLRADTTDAEDRLWRKLRSFPVEGTHFRRQAPIGPYIADFACMSVRLIIEVDGSQHGEDEGRRRDGRRTRWLEGEGYRVLRFWNNDVTRDIDAVLQVVFSALQTDKITPPRRAARVDPPPLGEGEERAERD